jgi:hypothetical protein
VGVDWLTFEPDFSDDLIQFFGESSEYLEIYVGDMGQIYNAACGPTHFLTNDFHFLGWLNSPKESNYKCDVEWWWELAWESYVWLVLMNIPAAIFLRVPMYYSWGLTLSL